MPSTRTVNECKKECANERGRERERGAACRWWKDGNGKHGVVYRKAVQEAAPPFVPGRFHVFHGHHPCRAGQCCGLVPSLPFRKKKTSCSHFIRILAAMSGDEGEKFTMGLTKTTLGYVYVKFWMSLVRKPTNLHSQGTIRKIAYYNFFLHLASPVIPSPLV